jgi:hypothetical protein
VATPGLEHPKGLVEIPIVRNQSCSSLLLHYRSV